jgi:hypothetical protein
MLELCDNCGRLLRGLVDWNSLDGKTGLDPAVVNAIDELLKNNPEFRQEVSQAIAWDIASEQVRGFFNRLKNN